MRRRQSQGSIRKRGGTWFARYYVNGRRVEESAETGDERAARSFLARRRREVADGTWSPLRASEAPRSLSLNDYLDGWLARRRGAGVRSASDETQWMRDYVRPTLGPRSLEEVRRVDVRDLIDAVARTTSAKTGQTLSARTVLHVYRTLSTAFADAVLDGLIAATPCTLKTRKGELPRKRDRNPEWRPSAVYSRTEAETLLTDARIPADRRAFYALMLCAGLRASEACGRRWCDLDSTATPLGRLVVASQADGARTSRETKTGDARVVPVVPALATVLDEWRTVGFPMLFGRHPQPSDPIIPTRSDPAGQSFRQATMMHQRITEDRERIGLRAVPHAQHAMRATFLSLLETAGANMAIARRATHAAPTDIVGGYIRTSWADLCAEVGKLPIDLSRPLAEVVALPARLAVGDAEQGHIRGAEQRTTTEEPVFRVEAMGPPGFEAAARPGTLVASTETSEPEPSGGASVRRLIPRRENREAHRGAHAPDALGSVCRELERAAMELDGAGLGRRAMELRALVARWRKG